MCLAWLCYWPEAWLPGYPERDPWRKIIQSVHLQLSPQVYEHCVEDGWWQLPYVQQRSLRNSLKKVRTQFLFLVLMLYVVVCFFCFTCWVVWLSLGFFWGGWGGLSLSFYQCLLDEFQSVTRGQSCPHEWFYWMKGYSVGFLLAPAGQTLQ